MNIEPSSSNDESRLRVASFKVLQRADVFGISNEFVDSSSANLTNEDFENVEREDEFGQPPLIVDRADKFETLCYSIDD